MSKQRELLFRRVGAFESNDRGFSAVAVFDALNWPVAAIALSFLFILAIASPARAQMSLQEAVLLAAQTDPGVEALRQEVAIKSVDIDAARDAYFPAISLSGETSTTASDGPGLVLSVTQLLFDWG